MGFTADNNDDNNDDDSKHSPPSPPPSVPKQSTRPTTKHKLRLYEVDSLLEDDSYCEYALLIRDGGCSNINGYYTCSGKKNGHYMFTHMNDNKAALFCANNGTWMLIYDGGRGTVHRTYERPYIARMAVAS